jgi:hypothetical protein
MFMHHHIIGIDPGLVDTGLVSIMLDPVAKAVHVDYEVAAGCDAAAVDAAIAWKTGLSNHYDSPVVFSWVEDYVPRSNLVQDKRMVEAVQLFHNKFSALPLRNFGVKQVVKQDLMQLLGVWNFSMRTHHQDLRSAARIGLYGALKRDQLNFVIARVVRNHLEGKTWHVHS